MNEEKNNFSSLIIGDGTLPIRCAEILLRSGHELTGVVTTDDQFRRWARDNDIASFFPAKDLVNNLKRPFDYLFSIVNEHILREDILSLPRKLAVNYHDALLPGYAGTHATSWALMNGECVHGISWHAITDVVDGGDLLKHRRIDISIVETALTLNTKCYEAAIEAFSDLVGDLARGGPVRTKQDQEKRTFFPRFKRPPNGAVISWRAPSRAISALVRALDFGPHPNPLGVAKVALGDDFLIVREVAICGATTASSPGTIIEIGKDFIRISTGDDDVLLKRLQLLDGENISIAEISERYDLREGQTLQDPDADMLRRIDDGIRVTCKFESYWVEKLSLIEPVAPPFANAVSAGAFTPDRTESFEVPKEFGKWIDQSGKHPTASDHLVAAFGAFISRLTGNERFDVGYSHIDIARMNRDLPDLFASQVPIRFQINGSENFNQLLFSVENETALARRNNTYPLDVFARYPKLRQSAGSGRGLTLPVAIAIVTDFDESRTFTANELTLELSERRPEYRFCYDRNKFESGSIDRLAEHFATFLGSIAEDRDFEINRLPLLTGAERDRQVFDWNKERVDAAGSRCVHEFFEEQAQHTPNAVALIFGTQRLTYQELDKRADQLAVRLRSLGVGPEVLVAICIERSVEMIVGILGILKAGGAYVPMDPAYPQARLGHILSDSQASVLLTRGVVAKGLGQHDATVVYLDSVTETNDGDPPHAAASSRVQPGNLAYVIYTSGSTGKPKGVAIEHRSTAAFLSWATSVFGVEKLKGTLASTSVCFDLSVFEMFAPLSCGGCVILVENILHLQAAPAANEVSLINTVPSAITELLRINGIPDSVTTVNLAGEALKTSLVRQVYGTGTVREVYDLYGPTEDTTYSTFTLRGDGKATIGRPISNTQAYILDRNLELLPVGIPGELYLGGDGLARGYLNQPEMTAERFIKNPFSEDATERLYKTGDLVRYLPSGEIEYLGRIDNQVKIRGFRIELGEVETVLSSHPAIVETAVVAREDKPGEKRLVAYFVSAEGKTLAVGDLREHIKKTLPDFMVPSAFVELAALPLTPNGKVDRKALPQPASTPQVSSSRFVAHRDDLESRLIGIWESILGIRPIGVRDNFFELGGHSLKAIRMFAEIEETFGKNIPLATLFDAGTVEKLAAILRQDGWSAPESSLVSIQPKGTKPPFFCIHAKGGNVLFYRDLAKHLGDDQPFYGLQARRLAGRQIGHGSVEEMAAFYIKEIQTIVPDGPYYLGGSSFGGLVAFEMAAQLQRQGARIALLALLDTGAPGYPELLPNTTALRMKAYRLVRRVQHHKDMLIAFNAKERTKYILDRLNKVKLKYRRRIRDTYKKGVRNIYGITKGANAVPTSYIQIEDLIWKAGQRYLPKIYKGKMTLFRASIQPLGIYPDPTLGWAGFVDGEIEMHEVPGHHGSIVAEPYVRTLAEKLSECLESVQLKEAFLLAESKPPERSARELVQAASVGSFS